MEFVLVSQQHLEQMCRITEDAKAQLKRLGLDQWQKGYPSRAVWEHDIQVRCTWAAAEGDRLLGLMAYQTEPEPSYAEIDGAWLTGDTPYASFHRVCVADDCKGQGVVGKLFAHGFELARSQGLASVRIDTHPGNLPMQAALKKAGFALCGNIILKDCVEAGDPRIAYEYLL